MYNHGLSKGIKERIWESKGIYIILELGKGKWWLLANIDGSPLENS